MAKRPDNFRERLSVVEQQLALSREEPAQRQFEQFCKDNIKKGNLAMDEVNK